MAVNIDSSNIRDLATDFSSVPARATRAAGQAVERIADQGMTLARVFAKESAGRHGKHYPKAITAEKKHPLGLTWAYGPDVAKRQGGMSFERGSRNQPPHLDLNRSADIIGARLSAVADAMAREVRGR